MIYIYIILGLAFLIMGGHFLVQSAVSVAEKLGVSSLLIGLTLVGFGTSMPELVTSLQAAFSGSPGIAVGNVIGSNIANILFILGLSAIVFPVMIQKASFIRDASFLTLATALTLGAVLYGQLTYFMGAGLLISLVIYISIVIKTEKTSPVRDDSPHKYTSDTHKLLLKNATHFVFGLCLTIAGAKLLVSGAINIASGLGVSETVIGVTIVAVGTSLPELVTSLVASFKKQGHIAYGNIIGSNIYNVFGILGITSLIKPIAVPISIAQFDIWVMCGAAILLVFSAISGWKISRNEGLLYLSLYAAYIFVTVKPGILF